MFWFLYFFGLFLISLASAAFGAEAGLRERPNFVAGVSTFLLVFGIGTMVGAMMYGIGQIIL